MPKAREKVEVEESEDADVELVSLEDVEEGGKADDETAGIEDVDLGEEAETADAEEDDTFLVVEEEEATMSPASWTAVRRAARKVKKKSRSFA